MGINDARVRRATGGGAPLGQRLALAMAGIAVLGLTFALGVLVGRQWSRPGPSVVQAPHQEAEPAAERRAQPRRSALVEPAAERGREGGDRLTFYQTLTAPLGVATGAPAARPRAEAAPRPEAARAEHARPDMPARPDAVARPAASSPAAATRPAAPAPVEPSAWTVQVGAFKDRGPAEALQRQLAGTGLDDARGSPAPGCDARCGGPATEGQPRYRVRVRQSTSRADARRVAERLRQERALAQLRRRGASAGAHARPSRSMRAVATRRRTGVARRPAAGARGPSWASLAREYRGRVPVLVPVLKGAAFFAADLVRAIGGDLELDYVAVASYGAGLRSSGAVRLTADLAGSIENRDVILVEDIVDSGRTLEFLRRNLATRHPRSLATCTLLDKVQRREVPVPLEYVGFAVPDRFVVGYGFDAGGLHRGLPDIHVLA